MANDAGQIIACSPATAPSCTRDTLRALARRVYRRPPTETEHAGDRDFVFGREDGSMLQRWECESKSKAAKHDHALAKACREAGLRRIGWHALRHTYASHLVMQGAGLLEVKELLGHASLEMTMRYAHLSPSARRKAVELLDGADGAPEGQHGDR